VLIIKIRAESIEPALCSTVMHVHMPFSSALVLYISNNNLDLGHFLVTCFEYYGNL